MKGLLPSEQWTLFNIGRLPWAAREKACACIGDRSHIEGQPGLTSQPLTQGGAAQTHLERCNFPGLGETHIEQSSPLQRTDGQAHSCVL